MNKTELLAAMSAQSDMSVGDCNRVLESFERVVSDELAKKLRRSGGWILLGIALFVSVCVFGQEKAMRAPVQSIRGIVIDGASRYPIPYATVQLTDKPEIGTVSDSLGRFSLSKVPVGRHSLQAAFMGYEPTLISEILVTSAKEVYLEVALKESVNELNEVVVQANSNRDEAMNKLAIAGARMLSVEEASRYAGGFDDPARLVSAFAGVAPGVSTNGISIHGNAPHLLQWRLEDVEIPNPNHFADITSLGGGILSSLSSQVLGNSDFFTGAFPSEYGNAVSGVFDMKLRNGNNQRYENAFQVGIMGIDFASEGPLSKKHKASYLFNYRYSTTGLLNLAGGTMDYQDLNFKLNFPTRIAGTFSVWGTSLIDKHANDYEDTPGKWDYLEDSSKSESKQYMAAGGLTHRYFFGADALLKTTVAATYTQQKAIADIHDMELNSFPFIDLNTRNTNLILTSSFNRKFSNRFTNKTGLTFTGMFYKMHLANVLYMGQPLNTISEGDGYTSLVSAYNSSSWGLTDRLTLNFGLYAQMLLLNNHWTTEPRAGIKWQVTSKSSFAFAYGQYSRMEKLDVYFVKTRSTGEESVNNNIDFTKAHHFMFSYGYRISDNMSLRVEPYVQLLYDVPVVAGSSSSILNRDVFYVEDAFVNTGKGRNAGIDITLERYLSKGLYYMITGSFFDSRYRGGDGKWYNTRFNRNYIVNGLIGKEWMLGRDKQNVLSVNLKLTFQGGDRYSPIDYEATFAHPDKEVQYDETRAFSKQYSPMLIGNYTVSFRMNKKRVSHEFAVKGLNFTKAKERYGHLYNLKTGEIDENNGATVLTNVSYKLEF